MLSCFLCQVDHDSTESYLSHLREFHKLTDSSNCFCNKCFINIALKNFQTHLKTHSSVKRKRENDDSSDFGFSLDTVKVENEDGLDEESRRLEQETMEENIQDVSLMDALKEIIQDDFWLLDRVFKLCKECNIKCDQLKDIRKHHLKILFPRTELGSLIRFEKLLNEWQSNLSLGKTEVQNPSIPRISVVESLQSNNFVDQEPSHLTILSPNSSELNFKVINHTRTLLRNIKALPLINHILYEANIVGIKGETILINKYGTIVENSELKFMTDEILMIAPSPDDWEPEPKTPQIVIEPHNMIDDSASENSSLNYLNEGPDNYKLPVSKFSESLKFMLSRKMKLEDKDVNTVIQIVVDDIRHIHNCAPIAVFRKAAELLISTYPFSFAIVNCKNEIVNTDTISLIQKMTNRNNYLNKSCTKYSMMDSKNQKNKIRKSNPDLSADDMKSYEEKRLWLKDNFNSIDDIDLVEKFFKDTFSYQRIYLSNILEPPTIDDIRDNWPILLKPRFLKFHYNLLFKKQMDLRKTILENIVKFNKILQKTNRIRSRKAISSEREFIEGVFEYFNELHHQIYTEYDIGTPMKQYNPSSVTPWMACQRISEKQYKFIVFLKGQPVCATTTFGEGFTLLLYSFLIFNIEYPSVGACSLEFLGILNGLDSTFTHNKKHFTNSQKSKILNFLKALYNV